MSFFRDCCPSCGAWIEQRTEGQNSAFHTVCGRLSKQLPWPSWDDPQPRLRSITWWKRMLVLAYERMKNRSAEAYPRLDDPSRPDIVWTRTSRMTKEEFSELIPFAEAWAVDHGVVFEAPRFDEERADAPY